MRRSLAAMVCLTLGCGPALPYRPGFLLEEPVVQPGKPLGAAAVRRVGCLDVRMALACSAAVPADFPLVAFTLGNRCDASIAVDFTRLRITGQMGGAVGDAPFTLLLFDPAHEVHTALLGSRATAREVLEYDVSPREATHRISEVCIDLGGFAEGSEQEAPVCLTRPAHACSS